MVKKRFNLNCHLFFRSKRFTLHAEYVNVSEKSCNAMAVTIRFENNENRFRATTNFSAFKSKRCHIQCIFEMCGFKPSNKMLD